MSEVRASVAGRLAGLAALRAGAWPRLLAPALILVVAAGCLPAAYYGMFSGFRDYDDEGYLLISLRDYARGGVLYDQVYTQYGPAYYQLLTTVFGLLGLEFTHTAGRAFVLALWVAVPALCAFATYRLTRNLAVTLATQLLVFLALVPLRDEPPHPGGLLSLLISAVVVAGTFLQTRGRPVAITLIGALLGAATLMKVNVGLFGVVSTVFVLLTAAHPGPGRRLVRTAAGAGLLLTPAVLMIGLAAMPLVRTYLVVGVLAALAVVLVAWTAAPRAFGWRDVALCGAAFATTLGASCAWELARGTTRAALARGILLAPLDQPGTLLLLLPIPPSAAWWALAAVAFAALLGVARRRGLIAQPLVTGLHGIGQILAGLFIWLVADERLPVGPLAPWALLWLALAPPRPDGDQEREVGTFLLVAIALLQALHAYPVAGSQVSWATFLFIPVGGVLIADGWRAVVVTGVTSGWRLLAPALATATLALSTASAFATGQLLGSAYREGVPLGLPGAESIRVTPRQAARYRLLTQNLARCTTFVTLPGLNSLYLFSQVEPPTMMNTTAWVTLLSRGQQLEIVERVSHMPDPVCAVRIRDAALDRFDTPLIRYIRDEFVPVFSVDDYAFMVERRPHARLIGSHGPASA